MEFIITQLNDNNRDDLSAMPEVLSMLICAFNQGEGKGTGYYVPKEKLFPYEDS